MKKTQCEQIVDHLKKHGEIDDLTAYTEYGIRRLASRIHDLKAQGYGITVMLRRGMNRDGLSTRYAVYSLKEDT